MEASALDYVAQACMDLNDALSVDDSDRDTILSNHIKKLTNIVAPIEDFKKSKLIMYILAVWCDLLFNFFFQYVALLFLYILFISCS